MLVFRQQDISQAEISAFIATLEIPAAAKERLLVLTPANYLGKATADLI